MHSFLCTASIPTHLFHHCQHPSNILFKTFMHSVHCLCTRSDNKLPLRSPASFIYYATRALDSLSLMMVHMLSSPFLVWIFNYSHHFLMQEVIILEVESWEKYGCDILVDCKCNSTQRVHKIYHIHSIFAIFCEYRVYQIHQNSNSSKAHQDREDVLVTHLHLRRGRSPLLGRKESYYCSHDAVVILDLGGRLHRLRSV